MRCPWCNSEMEFRNRNWGGTRKVQTVGRGGYIVSYVCDRYYCCYDHGLTVIRKFDGRILVYSGVIQLDVSNL